MFEPVSVSGSVGGAVAQATATSARARAEQGGEPSTAGVTRVAFSTRIKSDPAAGIMIAEYLSSTGEKQLQLPSAAVVAYLRSGLTAQGLPVHDEVTSAAVTTEA